MNERKLTYMGHELNPKLMPSTDAIDEMNRQYNEYVMSLMEWPPHGAILHSVRERVAKNNRNRFGPR